MFPDNAFYYAMASLLIYVIVYQVKSSSGGPVKNMSQKARRKMTMAQLESSSIAGHSPHGPNSKG